jgi:uncharacterized protein (DUF697 family)
MAEKEETLPNVDEVSPKPVLKEASSVMNKNILWAMGAGCIPLPLVDIAAVSGVQIKMLNELSGLYGVEFKSNRVKSIIAALVGGLTADTIARSTFNSWIKSIPILGFIGQVAMPVYSGATTYAVGKVFIQHFESGGTFLDFNPEKVKNYFASLYNQGKTVASNLAGSKA